MRTSKYLYVFVIQSDFGYGHGWEDECVEDTWRDCRDNLRLYRENSPYPVRYIQRRIPNPAHHA